ncbi:uncharacterized protein LOC111019713 [Momordica charantia]|uniref:Uncharacterized protein LOC111019713 n=1 Tax=Momordica charantia TaxID=3673 RepID=A0A6J1DCA2_MOMCH|nr:uncharacterized protein LOC111019713 [Momordica charantia]
MSPSAALPSAGNGESPSVYDILREFNFPIGLLPEGAVGCRLDRATGKLEAYLGGACQFRPDETYDLKYKSTISGQISRNRLTDLKGVSVKFMFFWVNIVEVVRVGDDLEFSVGMATASFPVENFSECPQCGCGIDCKNGKVRKINAKSLISSV